MSVDDSVESSGTSDFEELKDTGVSDKSEKGKKSGKSECCGSDQSCLCESDNVKKCYCGRHNVEDCHCDGIIKKVVLVGFFAVGVILVLAARKHYRA